ncbi:MAG: Kelch repeat-containing protein [Chthoniobacterales bacterium]
MLLFVGLTIQSNKLLAQGNTWATGPSIANSRVAPAAATIDNNLYVVGGFTDTGGPTPVLEVYDSLSGTWATRSPMPTARGRLAVGVINNIMYAVGGFGGENAVEAYDPSKDTWTTKAPVNEGRLGAAAGVIAGKLYVVGGTTNDSNQSVEEYDPVTDTWVFKAPMPTPRFLLAGAVIDSKFYAVGGTNSVTGGSGLGTLEVYDPASDTWQTNTPMPTPRSDLAAAVIDGKMYVVGGFGDPNVGTVLEAYDPGSDEWSTLAPMPTSRGDLAADVVSNKLFAVAGTAVPGATPLATVEIYTEPTPVITSPLVATGTVGLPFVYQFETSGATSLDVTNLPDGLSFDSSLSAIVGSASLDGTFQVGLSASNSSGTTDATLVITIQPAPLSGPMIISSTSAKGRTGSPFSFQVITSGASPAARLSATGLPPGLSVDPVTGLISGTVIVDGSSAVSLTVADGSQNTTGTLELTFSSDLTLPVIVSPNTAALLIDQPFNYTILAPSSDTTDPISYQLIGTLPAGLGFDSDNGTISGTFQNRSGKAPGPQLSGGIVTNVQLFASNSHGTGTIPLVFFQAPSGAVNISTRLDVGTGDDVLIGGFIITGNAPKKVIVRAIGPSLEVNGMPLVGRLADPILELHDSHGLLATNDNWRDTQEDEIIASTVPPTNNLESAIVATLAPLDTSVPGSGAYTVIVSGKNSGTGVALVEVYDLGTASLDISSQAQLANISTRGKVQTGDNVMIGGFIVGGSAASNILVRAIGPELTTQGVAGALQDTTLELHDGSGTLLASNDDWQSDQEQEIIATTIPPTDPRESAIVATLNPGNYTAIVAGKNNTTGVALVEAYVLP